MAATKEPALSTTNTQTSLWKDIWLHLFCYLIDGDDEFPLKSALKCILDTTKASAA